LPMPTPYPMLVFMDAHAVLTEVDRRLTALYGDPHPEHHDPLELLVRTILSQNTSDSNRDLAYESLRARFPRWEDVAAAQPHEIAQAIKQAGLHMQRGVRIHSVLQRVQQEQGRLSLAFLRDYTPEQAERWLLSLPGVGKKTAYIVLLMGFRIPRFPVDTHVARVTQRLGVRPPGGDPHAALAPLIPQRRELPLHLNLIQLGRRVCVARRPRCPHCPLPDLCRYITDKADPRLRAALRAGESPAVLVQRAEGVTTMNPDRTELLALLADPQVRSVEAACKVTPKEVT